MVETISSAHWEKEATLVFLSPNFTFIIDIYWLSETARRSLENFLKTINNRLI